MHPFSLSQDTVGYTCSCLSKIEEPSTKAGSKYVNQAKKLRTELQSTASSVAKTSNVSVSSEMMSDLFSFTASILNSNPLLPITSESLLILTYFVLREPSNVRQFDMRTLRIDDSIIDEKGNPPKNFSTYLALIIWHLFNKHQLELSKGTIIKQLLPLIENLCVCDVGLSGTSYINMCKILMGLVSTTIYAPRASLSLYHATLSLNKHLSSSRTNHELSDEYISTLNSYLRLLLKVLQFFSDESSTLLIPTGSGGGGIFRLPFSSGGGNTGDGAATQGSSTIGDTGFSARFIDIIGLTYNSALFQVVAHEELRRIIITTIYILFYFSNYFYLYPMIVQRVSEELLTIIPKKFIVTHSTQPIIVTVAFALLELIFRIYCYHIPARYIKSYFEDFIFKVLEEPDIPCGELKMSILAHVGRLFSGDTLNSTFVFGISELENFAFKYAYPNHDLFDINDYEYIKLLFPRPFNCIFSLFITFDCDFESTDLIYRLISVVTEYSISSSPKRKFSAQKYTTAQIQSTSDAQNISYQIPTMAYSFQMAVHKFFFHLVSKYLHCYDSSFASPVTTTSILAQDSGMKTSHASHGSHGLAKATHASIINAVESRTTTIILPESTDIVPNLLMYANYLGVNVYNISKSFNYLSPATCLLTNCTEAAVYALSRIAYSISYWSYLHQHDSIAEQKIPLDGAPSGSEQALRTHAELFTYKHNMYNITELMEEHNKKRLFDKGFLLFDRKMKKGIQYFVSNNQIIELIQLDTPTPLSLKEPPKVTGRKQTFDEDWYMTVYTMEKHKVEFQNASEHYKSVAQFLIDNFTENTLIKIGIPQDVIGEIIGGTHASNFCVLYEYVMLFFEKWNSLSKSTDTNIRLNSEGKLPVEEALRDIFGYFRLPGEGQVISRIITFISYAYVKSDLAVIKHHQVCFSFMYAIVMLNTDLHNAAVKTQRMTKDTFYKNTKYIDVADILTRELLDSVYDNISANPFSLGSIETKKEIVNLMDKYFMAPGGTKTLSNGITIKANAISPGSKDTTPNIIANGHQYYPYLAISCMREWIDVDIQLQSPRKSKRLTSMDKHLNKSTDSSHSSIMIVKLLEKYHFAFFESLLLKLDSSVHLELLHKLTQTPTINEQAFLLCLRPFFTMLSLLHCSLFRQTKPICRLVVDELIQLTNIKNISVLSINPNNYAQFTSKEYSTSHTDSKFERALSSLEVSKAKSTSICYNVTVIHAVLEFAYILSNLDKTKPPTTNPLAIESYSRKDLCGDPLFLSFANHFENKTSLLSNMYMGKLTGFDCWDLYLQIFACIEYYIDAADKNSFPRVDHSELLKIFNIETYKNDSSLNVSTKKSLISSMIVQSHRIDHDIQRIQKCLDLDNNEDEETEWDEASLIYYIYNLIDGHIFEAIYKRLASFSSKNLVELFRAFVSCSAQSFSITNNAVCNEKERVSYYFRKGIYLIENVAKNSLDRLKKTFTEIQPMISDAYNNPDENIVVFCLECYQSMIRTYFSRFKKQSTQFIQPSMSLEIPQVKVQNSRARSRTKSLRTPLNAPILEDSLKSETSSISSSTLSLNDTTFQRMLIAPLLCLIEKTTYIQVIDLVLNFLEELQLLYSVPDSLYTTISTVEDIARAVEITVTRISIKRDVTCNNINSPAQVDEVVSESDQNMQLTDSLEIKTESSTFYTPSTPGKRSLSPHLSPTSSLAQLPQSIEDELGRLSFLIARCDSIYKRILNLLDIESTLVIACIKMSYVLSQQQIDLGVANSAMGTFTKLIYFAHDSMINSISQMHSTGVTLTYYDSKYTDNLATMCPNNPYAEAFIFVIKICSQMTLDSSEVARRISVNLLREFVGKLIEGKLAPCRHSKITPQLILKEIIVESLLPSIYKKTKTMPRTSLYTCNASNLYVLTNHEPGKRVPILKRLWNARQKSEPVIATEGTRLQICDDVGCRYHTVLDILLDYILDQRMGTVIHGVILSGLENVIFMIGSRIILTFYKTITSYLCDILSILIEEKIQGSIKSDEEIEIVHGMGYSSPAQAMIFMTGIVDAVDMWVERAKAKCPQNVQEQSKHEEENKRSDELRSSGGYIGVYDYISHLINAYARLYERLERITQDVEVDQLHGLISRLITTIEVIQNSKFSGIDDENALLVGFFIAGSRMSGDKVINQIVLTKIVDVLQVYANLLEKAESSQSRAHEGMVVVVGAALTSLASLQWEQIASQRKTLFNLCISLIVSDSREIRIKIAVAMKALFIQ